MTETFNVVSKLPEQSFSYSAERVLALAFIVCKTLKPSCFFAHALILLVNSTAIKECSKSRPNTDQDSRSCPNHKQCEQCELQYSKG